MDYKALIELGEEKANRQLDYITAQLCGLFGWDSLDPLDFFRVVTEDNRKVPTISLAISYLSRRIAEKQETVYLEDALQDLVEEAIQTSSPKHINALADRLAELLERTQKARDTIRTFTRSSIPTRKKRKMDIESESKAQTLDNIQQLQRLKSLRRRESSAPAWTKAFEERRPSFSEENFVLNQLDDYIVDEDLRELGIISDEESESEEHVKENPLYDSEDSQDSTGSLADRVQGIDLEKWADPVEPPKKMRLEPPEYEVPVESPELARKIDEEIEALKGTLRIKKEPLDMDEDPSPDYPMSRGPSPEPEPDYDKAIGVASVPQIVRIKKEVEDSIVPRRRTTLSFQPSIPGLDESGVVNENVITPSLLKKQGVTVIEGPKRTIINRPPRKDYGSNEDPKVLKSSLLDDLKSKFSDK